MNGKFLKILYAAVAVLYTKNERKLSNQYSRAFYNLFIRQFSINTSIKIIHNNQEKSLYVLWIKIFLMWCVLCVCVYVIQGLFYSFLKKKYKKSSDDDDDGWLPEEYLNEFKHDDG